MIKAIKGWTPANRSFVAIGLSLTIGAQILVLASEYLGSVWPLWFGTPVMLKTVPVDPRSLFRGNYVRLNYDISAISKKKSHGRFKPSEVGYVTLQEEGGVFVATGLYRDRPESGVYIRGRITSVASDYRLKYGIEAYFMPKEKALKTELSVRQGANAEVFLLDNGKAAISRLKCLSEDCQD